jgi:DNA-binding transcriptional MerR regulator
MDHLLGIGEFAKLVGLSVSALRFYADRGLLVPAHIDPASGYRSFHANQVVVGRLIRDLRVIGIPLVKVHEALELPDADVRQLVDAHIAGLESELHEAQRTAERLGSAPEPSATRTTTVAAADLIHAFEQVLPFASTNTEHPHLMTVLVEVKAGSIRVVTTDTHRLAVRDLVALDTGTDFVALLPAATARRWLTELPPEHDIHLRLDGETFTASDGEAIASAQVVPAHFPDYEQVLAPPRTTTSMLVDRHDLISALERFDDSAGAVLLSVDEHHLHLRRRDFDLRLDGDRHGPSAHVAIDPGYGIDAAANAVGAELAIEIGPNPLRPIFFRSATNGSHVSLLMPVKLD